MKLTPKILIPLVLLLGLTFAVLDILSVQLIRSTILDEKAQFLIQHADKETSDVFSQADLEKFGTDPSLQPKLASYLHALEDPAIFRIKIWDSNDQLIYSDFRKLIGTSGSSETVRAAFANQNTAPQWQLVTRATDSAESGYVPYLHITIPIHDSRGKTRFVMEEYAASSVVLSKVSDYNTHVAIIAFLAAVVLFVGLYLSIRMVILRPLTRLENVMRIVGGGDLSYVVRAETKDEIGSLRRHFNSMRRELKNHVEELDSAKHSVEHQVVQRTKQLREERARLGASIDSLTIGFMIVSPQYAIIKANTSLAATLALDTQPEDFAAVERQLPGFDLRTKIAKVLTTQKPREFRELSVREKFLNIIISPVITSEDQVIIGAVIVVEDVTEEKIIKRSKDEFFSIASHELRTPLTAIHGNALMVEEFYVPKLKDPKLKEIIFSIKDSATYLIGIVNQFLDMSRLEQGHIDMKKRSIDFTEVVQESILELGPTATAKQLDLMMTKPPAALQPVYTDRDRAKQVIVNLLGNAIKYTDKGSVIISLVPEPGWIKLSVTDTGCGIPLKSQPLLFRKFQQASDNILTRDFTRSTGLGLYIARLIADGLGGEIGLESSVTGKGSTFVLRLPTAPDKKSGPS